MKFIIRIFLIVVSLLIVAAHGSAQHTERKTPSRLPTTPLVPVDTTKFGVISTAQTHSSILDTVKKGIDTVSYTRADSIVIDSVRIRFLPGMGQVNDDVDTTSALHQKQFLWSDAKVVGNLLWKLPGFFYRDLGEAGTWGQLHAFGLDGRGIGILLDGRPMNDPVTGTYNLSDMPLEFIDHAEILSSSASVFASGEDGVAVNFVSRSYNSFRPLTKLRFAQDPKGTILTDGLYTQNVARGLNLMIGFQRTTTTGRFANANLDAWNVRTRLRYNISDRFNIALTDFYTKASNGLNGGVDPFRSTSLFDEQSAAVVNKYAYDVRSRRDVTLSAIARIFSDSSSTTNANFYYSTMDREYFNPLNSIDDSTKASFWGIRIQQHLALNPVRLTVGGTMERRRSDSTRTLPSHIESDNAFFAQAELRLIQVFVPSLTLRSASSGGNQSLSSGIGVKSEFADWLTLFVDASWYDRFPTLQERSWRDSTVTGSSEILKEQHVFVQAGIELHAGSNLQLSLTGFQRTVKNAIVYLPEVTQYGSPAVRISNINEVSSLGLNGKALMTWRHFEVFGVMTLTRYTQAGVLKALTPDIILAGEVSYRNTFFKEKLDAKFGVRSCFYNRELGMQFDPQMLSYIQYNNILIGKSTTFDLFMILKIGDAHIALSWNNILSAGYFLAPIYPMPGRSIRVGVHWVFMD